MEHTCQTSIRIQERKLTTRPYETPPAVVYERMYHGGHGPQFEASAASPMSTVTLSPPGPATTNSIASGSASPTCCKRRRIAAKTPPPVSSTRAAMRTLKGNLTVMSSDMGYFEEWAEGQGMVVGGGRERGGQRSFAAANQIPVFGVLTPPNLVSQNDEP